MHKIFMILMMIVPFSEGVSNPAFTEDEKFRLEMITPSQAMIDRVL